MVDELVLPDYGGACIANIVPALLGPPDETPAWMPAGVADASQVVLFVVDGLGWEQLQARLRLAPTLASMTGGSVTTVAPSTTSTALTSLTTGLPPGEHGVVGYRIAAQGEVLNVLRWSTVAGDARQTIPPSKLQPSAPFLGERPAVVTRAEYRRSGFTGAHLDPARFWGYRTMATMVTEVGRLVRAGEPFVYAYYDGLDKVAHEYGLGEHYDAELAWIDHTVERLLTELRPGTALLVTADHGQVEVGGNVIPLAAEVLAECHMQSGEGGSAGSTPGRAGPGRCGTRPAPATATTPGSAPATRSCRSDGSGRSSRRRRSPGWGTWRWRPAPTSRSTTRWTPARTSWWAGTGP